MSPDVYRVLLIEDNEGDAFLLKEMLEDGVGGNFQLECCETLTEGFAQIAKGGLDLVLLDLGLPESTGIETFYKVKATCPGMPVIVLTSLDDEAVALAVVHAGAQDYLLKGQTDGRNLSRAIRYAIERKRTEEALRLTQFAVDNAVDAAHWIRPDGRLFYVNEAACRSLGYSRDELLSMRIQDCDPFVDDEAWSHYWATLKEQKRLVFTTEHKTKGGRTFPVEVTANYVKYGNDEFVCAFARDISERVAAEEERNKLQSQLLHAQKMEAIGQLAGGIAHDFNNILTGIIGYGNLLQMTLSAGTPPRVYADSILSSGEKAAKLTQSLLAFSRKQGIQQSPQSLHEIVRSLEPLLRRLVPEDIDFHVVYSSIDPTIFADSVQIDQVIINLVTNARDAMAGGGLLTVRTDMGEVDGEKAEELGLKEPGSYAILSVEDSGVGISEEVKARLFDPFFTTKEVGQGTGLGLSIVYGIVGQHGGAIAVQSRLGKGSRFDVYLPIHQARVAANNRRPLQPIGGNETILLAEDDESVRKMVSTVLTVSGYTVIEAEDGEGALSKFLKHQDEIDLVILDVVMPKKNGREVCEWIRERKPAVKFLFTSGYTKNIIDGKGFSEEGADFIAKPAHPNDLLAKIRDILGPTP